MHPYAAMALPGHGRLLPAAPVAAHGPAL